MIDLSASKYCRDCDQTLPIETHFHLRTRNGKQRPQTYCKECMQLRWHKWNNKARGIPEPEPQGWPPDLFAAWGKPASLVWRI